MWVAKAKGKRMPVHLHLLLRRNAGEKSNHKPLLLRRQPLSQLLIELNTGKNVVLTTEVEQGNVIRVMVAEAMLTAPGCQIWHLMDRQLKMVVQVLK